MFDTVLHELSDFPLQVGGKELLQPVLQLSKRDWHEKISQSRNWVASFQWSYSSSDMVVSVAVSFQPWTVWKVDEVSIQLLRNGIIGMWPKSKPVANPTFREEDLSGTTHS